MTSVPHSGAPTPVAMNLAGIVEHPTLTGGPYLVDADGRPYVPVGEGGVTLGVELGMGVFDVEAEHASPGVALVHPDQGARHALVGLSCLGNEVVVRSGAAGGAAGVVLGKTGEAGRVLVWFPPEVRERVVPGDAVMVRVLGQGARLAAALDGAGVQLLNVSPSFVERLPLTIGSEIVSVRARATVPSMIVGNGIGRPAHQWALDLQVGASRPDLPGLARLAIGDLVVVADLDVRHNAGYRRGWCTVGVVVTTASPRPGHGAALMPLLTGPARCISVEHEETDHVGLTTEMLSDVVARP